MSKFPGGHEALLTYIAGTIEYGPIVQGNAIQGRVIVKFVVNKDVNVINPQVIRGLDPFLDKEALRLVSKLPQWKPRIQNGKKVIVWYSVPVLFSLQ